MPTTNTDNTPSSPIGSAVQGEETLRIRCPRCRHQSPHTMLTDETEHELTCPVCSHSFRWVRPDSGAPYGNVHIPSPTDPRPAEPAPLPQPPAPILCPQCGRQAPAQSDYCPQCGMSLNRHAARRRVAHDTSTWYAEGSNGVAEPLYIPRRPMARPMRMVHLGWTILVILLMVICVLTAILLWWRWEY